VYDIVLSALVIWIAPGVNSYKAYPLCIRFCLVLTVESVERICAMNCHLDWSAPFRSTAKLSKIRNNQMSRAEPVSNGQKQFGENYCYANKMYNGT
jgi:hypothetical protein